MPWTPGYRIIHDLIPRCAQVDAHEHGARAAVVDDDRAGEQVIADRIRRDRKSLSFGVKSTLCAPARSRIVPP